MDWHFSENGAPAGPVPQTEFDSLVRAGRINSGTLVWREGMPDWVRYGDLAAGGSTLTATGTGVGAATGATHVCAECGQIFPEADMISFGNAWVCAACKPRFVQKLKEGIVPRGVLRYAGFWIRVVAKIIDVIILMVANFFIGLLIGMAFGAQVRNPNTMPVGQIISGLVSLVVGISYSAGFNGRFGATPGKMVLNLKIVRPDGEPISYARAIGRYFAEILSSLILGIGYMMAGWDEQKRALHDRVCDTRVIRQ